MFRISLHSAAPDLDGWHEAGGQHSCPQRPLRAPLHPPPGDRVAGSTSSSSADFRSTDLDRRGKVACTLHDTVGGDDSRLEGRLRHRPDV